MRITNIFLIIIWISLSILSDLSLATDIPRFSTEQTTELKKILTHRGEIDGVSVEAALEPGETAETSWIKVTTFAGISSLESIYRLELGSSKIEMIVSRPR